MTQLSASIHRLKREARILARDEGIALHAALDRVAAREGYARWSLLRARAAAPGGGVDLLAWLVPGDLALIGARPGHGKTRLGLQLLADAARAGRRAVFFTLEYSDTEAAERIRSLPGGGHASVEVVASDDVCADLVVRHLAEAPRGTVAVVDYLQILDQRRSKPPVADQVDALGRVARERGFVLAFISQIDRGFVPRPGSVPGPGDIRLPNPVAAGAFSKACFVHGGRSVLHDLA